MRGARGAERAGRAGPESPGSDNALRQMVTPLHAGPDRMAPHVHDAAETAVGKAARELFDIRATFDTPRVARLSRADLLAALPQPLMAWPLPARRAPFGLLALDTLLVNALVELATNAPDALVFRDQRLPSAIDAALCRPFCARFVELLIGGFSDDPHLPDLPAMNPEHHETDPHRLTYQLDQGDHDMFSASVSFQDGLRGGVMVIALPVSLCADQVSGSARRANWRQRLEAHVASAPLALRADIEQIEMPLSRLLALARGDLLPISATALGDVSLHAGDGRILIKGRLGQKGRQKAVSITENRLARNRPVGSADGGPSAGVSGRQCRTANDGDMSQAADPAEPTTPPVPP